MQVDASDAEYPVAREDALREPLRRERGRSIHSLDIDGYVRRGTTMGARMRYRSGAEKSASVWRWGPIVAVWFC